MRIALGLFSTNTFRLLLRRKPKRTPPSGDNGLEKIARERKKMSRKLPKIDHTIAFLEKAEDLASEGTQEQLMTVVVKEFADYVNAADKMAETYISRPELTDFLNRLRGTTDDKDESRQKVLHLILAFVNKSRYS